MVQVSLAMSAVWRARINASSECTIMELALWYRPRSSIGTKNQEICRISPCSFEWPNIPITLHEATANLLRANSFGFFLLHASTRIRIDWFRERNPWVNCSGSKHIPVPASVLFRGLWSSKGFCRFNSTPFASIDWPNISRAARAWKIACLISNNLVML